MTLSSPSGSLTVHDAVHLLMNIRYVFLDEASRNPKTANRVMAGLGIEVKFVSCSRLYTTYSLSYKGACFTHVNIRNPCLSPPIVGGYGGVKRVGIINRGGRMEEEND
jgi:hypothetical protein